MIHDSTFSFHSQSRSYLIEKGFSCCYLKLIYSENMFSKSPPNKNRERKMNKVIHTWTLGQLTFKSPNIHERNDIK